jgi:phospholipase/carboxylesterase
VTGSARTVPFTRDVTVRYLAPAAHGDGSLLLALHGQGMSGERFAQWVAPLLPEQTAALLPDGPLPFEIRGSRGIRQGNGWYLYLGDGAAFVAEMERTGAWLLDLLADEVARRGIDPARVSLLGFSQGGYLAGHLGVTHAGRFRRLVVAGARMKDEVLADAAPRAAAAGLEVLAVHGAEDPNVAPDASRRSADALTAAGLPVRFATFPGGHDVLREPACIETVRRFLGGA